MEDNDESAAHDEDSEMPESSSRKLDVDDDDETMDEVSKFRTHPRLFLPGNMRYQTAHLMFPCLPEDVVLGTQSLLLPKGPARAMNKGALEYGDPVNPNHFMASYAAQTEAAIRTEEMRRKEDEKRAEEEIEATLAALPAPHHLQQFKSTVEVICRVEVVDFSGKPDAAAVKNLVQAMAPRRIVFVDGTETETRQMADILRMGQPLIPSRGEWTDITVELHSLNVNLSERMMGSIHMHRTQEGIEIGFAEGRLAVEDGGRNEWIIEPASLGHNTVFVGDLKLADLRSVLVKAGFDAQFLPQSGALSCAGGNVFIRKTSGTTIAIESTVCKEYFAIRSLLYQQFVNV
jgi:cleavage and polyadenylation specificity factor subunit 2